MNEYIIMNPAWIIFIFIPMQFRIELLLLLKRKRELMKAQWCRSTKAALMLSQENPSPTCHPHRVERLGLILPLLKNLLQPPSIIKNNCNSHYHSQQGPIILLLLPPLPSLLQLHWPSCYLFLPHGLCTSSFCCLEHCLLVLIIADSLSFNSNIISQRPLWWPQLKQPPLDTSLHFCVPYHWWKFFCLFT